MARRSSSQKKDEPQSSAEGPSSTQFQQLASIDLELADSLESDPDFRDRYLRRWAANEVAGEIRTMRKRRILRQADLARLAKTGQSAISRIEKEDYDAWTFKILMNIAIALKARLRVHLEPIEDVIKGHRAYESDNKGIDVASDVGATGEAANVARGDDTQVSLFTSDAGVSGLVT